MAALLLLTMAAAMEVQAGTARSGDGVAIHYEARGRHSDGYWRCRWG